MNVEMQSIAGQNVPKVSPFGGPQAQTLELGGAPANARNLNAQSVMAESQSMVDSESKPLQVNLRKTFNLPNGGGQNVQNNHFATINGDSVVTGGKLN